MINLQRLRPVFLVGALLITALVLDSVNGYAQTNPSKTLFACGFGDKPDVSLARFSKVQSNLLKEGWSIKLITLSEAIVQAEEGGTIWMWVGSSEAKEVSPDSAQSLKKFVSKGGTLLITVGAGVSQNDSAKQLLRDFGIMLSGKESSPKLQQLKAPPFTGLKWFCSKTALLDIGEEAISMPVLVSNDTDQAPTIKGAPDFAGFRVVLGTIGKGKLVVSTAGESFQNENLNPTDPTLANDNYQVFIRMLNWLQP